MRTRVPVGAGDAREDVGDFVRAVGSLAGRVRGVARRGQQKQTAETVVRRDSVARNVVRSARGRPHVVRVGRDRWSVERGVRPRSHRHRRTVVDRVKTEYSYGSPLPLCGSTTLAVRFAHRSHVPRRSLRSRLVLAARGLAPARPCLHRRTRAGRLASLVSQGPRSLPSVAHEDSARPSRFASLSLGSPSVEPHSGRPLPKPTRTTAPQPHPPQPPRSLPSVARPSRAFLARADSRFVHSYRSGGIHTESEVLRSDGLCEVERSETSHRQDRSKIGRR